MQGLASNSINSILKHSVVPWIVGYNNKKLINRVLIDLMNFLLVECRVKYCLFNPVKITHEYKIRDKVKIESIM